MNKRLLIILIVLVVIGGGTWYARLHWRGASQNALVLYGNVDIREVNLGFRVSGRLKEMLHDEGDPVKTGETLSRLDDEPYHHQLDEACGQVASLQARLALLQAGNRPQEIEQARAQMHEREVTFANAERIYKRQQELFTSRTVSIQERDDAEAAYREAEARLASAREQLNLLQAGFRTEEIAQAKADLARAKAAQATTELQLEDTTLKAPADGIVLTRAQEPGAIVQAGTTVFTVSLEKPVWVRAYIREPDLGQIHPGMKVAVYSDSAPAKAYPGTIGYISPRAEFTPKNVETTELRTSLVYRLRIVIASPDEGLRQGMPVTVKLNQ
ncbi:MAG TPA: secretion protein HlyD [Verrucomicrobiae bacterium]|nr:secretion protein HlyD [Verrucomicrobiae bacterium]